MTEPRWDDERLRQAYRDRFGGPASPDLVGAVIDDLPIRHRSANRRALALVAAVAIVATTVGVGMVLSPAPFLMPPRQSTPPATPPLVDGFPTEALGLPVISVSEALALRDAGPKDTEIAVRGWQPPPPAHPISCPAELRAPTPVEVRCPEFLTSWLTEEPETLFRATPTGSEGSPPSGPALRTLVRIEVPREPVDSVAFPEEPLRVILVGHFADYRSLLCPEVEACRREFVVDARAWVDGHAAGHEVVELLDRWNDSEQGYETLVPRLRAQPAAEIATRAAGTPLAAPWLAVMTGDYLRDVDPRVADLLPLATADVVWVVRALVDDSGRPVAQTMFVDDATGQLYVSKAAGLTAIGSTVNDDPHFSFPAEVHGLSVISVAEALAELNNKGVGLMEDTELAVRGFYVVPPPSVACVLPRSVEPLPPIDRSCPDGLVWLMDEAERPWELVDGLPRWHRPIRPALNPVVRPDVPFDLPRLFGDVIDPDPLPVVVLGHFRDARAMTDREAREFVVDALAWRLGEASGSQTVILGAHPAEQRAAVEARVEAALGPARATWAAVMDGPALIGTQASPSQELLTADAVWQLARLVEDAGRPVVRYAYTVDRGTRIWEPGGRLTPERRVDIVASGGGTVVEVIDVPDIVVTAREVAPEVPDPAAPRVFTEGVTVPVAISNPTDRPNELRLHWTGTDCDERWTVYVGGDGRSMDLTPTRRRDCQAVAVDIDIVLTFSEPVPADEVMIGGFGASG